MRSSVFARWVTSRKFDSHVVLPGLISLVLIGMYFSGFLDLQNIVAPSVAAGPGFDWREYGALGLLQSVFLLCVIFYSLRCFMASPEKKIKMISLLILMLAIFALFKEMEQGVYTLKYFTSQLDAQSSTGWSWGWLNWAGLSGGDNADPFRLVAILAIIPGFVLAPVFFSGHRNPTIRLLVPSKWLIYTVILTVLLTWLVLSLEDAGHAINNISLGGLHQDVLEFADLNIYYMFVLYTALLHERIIIRRKAPVRGPIL